MFPLLPALILLFLNGPAHMERLAEGGALPAALAAVQQRLEAPDKRADQLALASLLAFSGDKEASRLLVKILALQTVEERPAVQPVVETEAKVDPPQERCLGQTREGFLRSQRSRDGPAAR